MPVFMHYIHIFVIDANQWMVADLSKFETGVGPSGGFLTVLEEIPGYMHIADLSYHLEVRC
jgi:hypothetical protein